MDKYYNAYDKRYEKIHSLGMEWEENRPSPIVYEIIKKYDLKGDMLEIGCGEGRDTSFLQNLAYNVKGCDVSPNVIEYCRKKYNSNNYFVLDVLTQDIPEHFDFIYSVAVIHMLVDDVDRLNFFKFINTHLKANSIALICSMGDGVEEKITDKNKAFNIVKRTCKGKIVEVVETTCRIVNWEKLSSEVLNSGLKILEKGVVKNTPGFNSMMYVVVKK